MTSGERTLGVVALEWVRARKNRPLVIVGGAALIAVVIVGGAFIASDEERGIRRHQRSFVAENCSATPTTADPAADFHACERAIATKKDAVDKKQASYAKNTEAIQEANERAARASSRTSPGADVSKALAQAKAFLVYCAAHRNAPGQIKTDDPVDCAPSGLCSTSLDIGEDDDRTFCELSYFKGSTAARFTAHFPVRLTCEVLGATTVKTWPAAIVAPGSTCTFRSGPLSGLRMLIENNNDSYGLTTGVHVYSSEYEQRDADFAEGVRTDEANAR